uniref:Uncharacterized protein n=1 Tax=Siphoviridae sp. ctLqe90 TaxID=2825456 RepID=A0A8S5Q2B3_9CAUD|nr:MAG TPA: hypothetical protein [Siphoviridae sp. ctLqe90]DAG35993.1 MAG TPA: hypothetical protein [Caudoviricetes sp.]DAZ23758.1 MAG TPA: hypothetical protein [Caudoviricetes sp.]
MHKTLKLNSNVLRNSLYTWYMRYVAQTRFTNP